MTEPVHLKTPLDPQAVRALKAGMQVLLDGTVITARDAAHRYLAEKDDSEKLPFELSGGVIYHCGPVMQQTIGGWSVVSAGPTTSSRMEIYQAEVIRRYDIRAIIGKGGMGPKTAEALSHAGAVYLAAASGAGALLARRITKVAGVWKLEEFGTPEAMWALEVEDFPAVVAMDPSGGSIYSEVERFSAARLKELRGD